MKILFLSHRLPFPPDRGDKIRMYNHLRHLSRQHRITLVSFLHSTDDPHAHRHLRQLCETVELVACDARANFRGVLSLARGGAFSAGYFGGWRMRAVLQRLMARERFEVAWASASSLAPLLDVATTSFRVVDSVDLDSAKWRQFAAHSRPPLRWLYDLEARQVRRLERDIARTADQVLFVSRPEAAAFRALVGDVARVQVIRSGVDTAFFQPVRRRARTGAPTLLFTGTLDYLPNHRAALFLIQHVFPLVRRHLPAVHLTVAGHRPARALRAAARNAGGAVTITGSVDDIRPFYAAADVYAATVPFGRGVKNKVLEAMAMGLPVVATACALDGLEVERGRHVLEAASAPEFAEAILALLGDAAYAQQIGAAGREWVRETHQWGACAQPIDALLPTGGEVTCSTDRCG